MEKAPPGTASLAPDEFRVTVGNRCYTIGVVDHQKIRVDGTEYRFNLHQLSPSNFSLILDNSVYEITPLPDRRTGEESRSEIAVNGTPFEVTVDDRRSLLRKRVLKNRSAEGSTQSIRAPMPGKVVRVEVKSGDQVRPGTGLIILEAMKMENEIRSTGKGIVESVKVETGKAVEKDELLITIRPE